MNQKISQYSNHRQGFLLRMLPAAATFFVSLLAAPAQAVVALPDVPLFTTSAGKANVLMILDNSNSMDEAANGAAVGSNSPASKSEIARNVIKGLITNYTGKFNMGLMAYRQNNLVGNYLHNSPYDASYNPADFDPTFAGARDSQTKRFRTPNVSSAGSYIYYNVALPFYSAGSQGNAFCYAPTANAFNNGENPSTGPWDTYRCFTKKIGISNVMPTFGNATSELAQGYSSLLFTGRLSPTDSDLAQGIVDFGKLLTWNVVGRTWFNNASPGRGYLHVPIKDLDAAQAAAISAKLACNIPGTPTGCTNAGLKNAGLTPLEGTLLTAKDYFKGTWNNAAEGYTESTYPLPTTCKHNYVILLTDGLPSTNKNGVLLANPALAVTQAAAAAAALKADTTETYVIGFALPFGTDPTTLDQIAVAGGTGTAYNASDAATLNAALTAIFADIDLKSGSASAVAANSTSLNSETNVFSAKFNTQEWSGELQAFRIIPRTVGLVTTYHVDPVSAWRASENIPAFGSRNILTWDGSAGAGFPTVAQTLALTAPVAAYLAGERTGEGTIYRTRANLLGDIVHSSPVYVKDSDTVYVGANDGMLHAFNASTGREQFAYVPGGINLAALKTLSNPAYAHRYFVDGELVVSTKQQTPDKNILVGLLGAGGKSVYALDVTSPVTMTPSKVLWEFSDPDLGNALGKPVVVELNNGKTGVMFGNGYNSALEHSVLFILDIQTGAVIKKLDSLKGSSALSNGMAAPIGWDLDDSGTVDLLYAGDLLGNVWKFDVSGNSPATWDSAFKAAGKPKPFFVAMDDASKPQPITGAMSMGLNPTTFASSLFFGTGRYLTLDDPANQDVQSWYGLIDAGAVIAGRNALLRRKIVNDTTSFGTHVRAFEFAVDGDMAGKFGWFVDWVKPPFPPGTPEGERVVSDTIVTFTNELGPVLVAASIIPNAAACGSGGRGFINALDPYTGASFANTQGTDLNGNATIISNGYFDVNENRNMHDDIIPDGGGDPAPAPIGSVDGGVGMPSTPILLGPVLVCDGSSGQTCDMSVGGTPVQGRISWREILGD